jgi:uncharacterized protein (TIGR03790 family)
VTCLWVFVPRSVSAALSPTQVTVLYNTDSADSIQIAAYYAQVHPGVRLLPLYGVSDAEEITQDHYLNVIRPQVLAGLTDNTSVIVTTKGLPLRIKNTLSNPGTYPGWRGTQYNMSIPNDWWKPYSSLESELTRIDRIGTAEEMGDQGYMLSPPAFAFDSKHHAVNPYYGSLAGFDRGKPVNEGIRLTARLDGFTVEDVMLSIMRAQNVYAKPSYQYVVVDDDPTAPGSMVDRMDQLANQMLKPAGWKYLYDQTDAAITAAPGPVIGYVSHGSQAGFPNYFNDLDFTLAPGAVFHSYESFNAYSFVQGGNRYGQGLIGDWLAMGGTAGLGHVEEPKAERTTVADEAIFYDRLMRGYSFVEAAWAATYQLSYVNTVVGDPLMTIKPWLEGDINFDGMVGISDLSMVLSNWNKYVDQGDLDGDRFVGLQDLNILLNNWGKSAIPPGGAANIPSPASALLSLPISAALLLRRHAA